MANNYYRRIQMMAGYEKKVLKSYPDLPNCSGIYVLTRDDESGLKMAYIGQAKHIKERIVNHFMQYNHIDLSLKKRGFYSETNPYGWKLNWVICSNEELDELERYNILNFSQNGYQLYNKTSGGQDDQKIGLENSESPRGYHDGLEQGYKNCKKDVRQYFKYLKPTVNQFKKDGNPTEISVKKLNEFNEFLEEKDND